jgi:hypothetical protein
MESSPVKSTSAEKQIEQSKGKDPVNPQKSRDFKDIRNKVTAANSTNMETLVTIPKGAQLNEKKK